MTLNSTPFLSPGFAWGLVVIFSVLWIALGIAWGRRGKGDADEYCRKYEANTGWNNRRTGGLNDVKHSLFAENIGNDNHKGKK